MAVPWPTLGHYQGDSLTNPMLITAFIHIWPKGHREPCNEVGSLSPAERLASFELGTFRFLLQRVNPLGHTPQVDWSEPRSESQTGVKIRITLKNNENYVFCPNQIQNCSSQIKEMKATIFSFQLKKITSIDCKQMMLDIEMYLFPLS